jgi:hypothetical protein
MNLLGSTYPRFHYSPTSLASEVTSSSPHRSGDAKFPDLLWPGAFSKAVNGFLTRVVRESMDPEYSFIASTALAALTKDTLSLSLPPAKGAQQAQYGIAVCNRANEFLGRLNFYVKYSATGGYEATAVNFRRSDTSPPVNLSLSPYDVFEKPPIRAGQDLLSCAAKARTDLRVRHSELIKARSKLTETTRKFGTSNVNA